MIAGPSATTTTDAMTAIAIATRVTSAVRLGNGAPCGSACTCSDAARSTSNSATSVAPAQHSSSTLVSAPENDACRSAPRPPTPRSSTTTRRVDSDGNANTPSNAAAAPAIAPNASGNPTRLAAIAPTAASAIESGTATMRHATASGRDVGRCAIFIARSRASGRRCSRRRPTGPPEPCFRSHAASPPASPAAARPACRHPRARGGG